MGGTAITVFLILLIGGIVYVNYTEEINDEYYRLKEKYYDPYYNEKHETMGRDQEVTEEIEVTTYPFSEANFEVLEHIFENPEDHRVKCNTKLQRGYCFEREDNNCWDTVYIEFRIIQVPREHLYGRCYTHLGEETLDPINFFPDDFSEYLAYKIADRIDITVDTSYSVCCKLSGQDFDYEEACFLGVIPNQC